MNYVNFHSLLYIKLIYRNKGDHMIIFDIQDVTTEAEAQAVAD